MALQVVRSEAAPAAIGPYSQGMRAGDFIFFSGQIPLDPGSGEVVSGGITAQIEQVMANCAAMLAAGGVGFERVVKTTIFLVDMADFAVVNAVYGRFFPTNPPARSTVQVAALPRGVAVEVEMVVYCGA
ncbi:MAG: reactive intermediate/imine deaminase [Deltaproteobacteria bacterium HGW-Deltaproteobacteria-4]|nr:MAG: reactive intermediate/imine deaminase [Deltaproteobacteria bacterium HGW-Deltaproteobacteria-4]